MSLTILTPIATVMTQLVREMQTVHTDMKKVYNPELSYDEGVKYMRAGTDFNDIITDAGESPVFMFNRSAIRRDEQVGRRWEMKPIVRDTVVGTAQEYRTGWCEWEMRFLYITSDFRKLEQFEIGYVIGEGVKDIKEFNVDLSDYGLSNFPYLTSWKPLEEIQVGVEQSSYTGIAGTVTIKGHLALLRGEIKTIKEIDFTMSDWEDFELKLVSVVPT